MTKEKNLYKVFILKEIVLENLLFLFKKPYPANAVATMIQKF